MLLPLEVQYKKRRKTTKAKHYSMQGNFVCIEIQYQPMLLRSNANIHCNGRTKLDYLHYNDKRTYLMIQQIQTSKEWNKKIQISIIARSIARTVTDPSKIRIEGSSPKYENDVCVRFFCLFCPAYVEALRLVDPPSRESYQVACKIHGFRS